MTNTIRTLTIVALSALALLGLGTGSAFGAYTHSNIEAEFSIGSECTEIREVDVQESEGLVYALCARGFGQSWVKRFDLAGNPAPFSAAKPYISGNALTTDPGSVEGSIKHLAVDTSGGPNDGLLYVAGAVNIDVFNAAGEFIGIIKQKTEGGAGNFNRDVAIGPDGTPYVTSTNPGGRVSKYNLSWREKQRIYTSLYSDPSPMVIRPDTTGAIWMTRAGFEGAGSVWKYEEDQFINNLNLPPNSNDQLISSVKASPSPFVPGTPSVFGGTPLIAETNVPSLDVDWNTDDVLVDRGGVIETFSQGTVQEDVYKNAPDFGSGQINGSTTIDVTRDNRVWVGSGTRNLIRFGLGDIVPDVTTDRPQIDNVGHVDATVTGTISLDGGTPVDTCELEYGKTAAYGTKVACTPDAAGANYTSDTDVSAQLTGLEPGSVYHYRFAAANPKGENVGVDRRLVAAYVVGLKTLPATEVETDRGTLNGSLDPDGEAVDYYFEYGVTTAYGQVTPTESLTASSGTVNVSEDVTGLPSGTTLHYRIVASSPSGTTYGPDETFRTGSTPLIAGVRASELGETTATVNATVNPVGYDTEFQFEYGITPSYGSKAPAGFVAIGNGTDQVAIEQQLTGLQSGVTYHYRLVAKNKWGTAVSPDTTFDYQPPTCPNAHVRQQTKSSYLPDCRAYELVSPESAGGVQLFPGSLIWEGGNQNEYLERSNFASTNSGFASSPPRFTFWGGLGQITGLPAPNSEQDMYMSTRTNEGWFSTLPGLDESEATAGTNKQCSTTMDLCIDTRAGSPAKFEAFDYAPYLFTAEGQKLGQLPTNLNAIDAPDPYSFHGVKRMSGDFSHFVFSSTEYEPAFGNPAVRVPGVSFAPGALTTGIGSAYDNDIAAKSVKIISRLPDGSDIPGAPGDDHAIEFPGISEDGSHILMQTKAENGPAHLYMAVDGINYDVSKGAGVKFAGMTSDGGTVYFTTGARLTSDDTDNSTDLYLWDEQSDELTRVSQGGGNGNSDECHGNWTDNCSVALVEPEHLHPVENSAISVPGNDDTMGSQSGAIFFYSPEQLDPSRPAVPDQRNLYVYRDGEAQFAGSFDDGTDISRMQVSPNGDKAAWVTGSRMTSYDSDGFKEMYAYDADSRSIECASCNPRGISPVADVEASQSGPFMSNDGRAFFASKDSLVPRDRNGEITDIYEYVDGRPQLITSGVGSRDFTGGGELYKLTERPQYIGLESVSRNGADVFFTTYETLVDSDLNGAFVKFYDARAGGGFPEDPALAPCAAADECHGADSSEPAPPVVATGTVIGKGGNHEQAKSKKKKSKKKKSKKKKSKKKNKSNKKRKHQQTGRGR
jgi:hypothetical protein